jgi:hypothetical protein
MERIGIQGELSHRSLLGRVGRQSEIEGESAVVTIEAGFEGVKLAGPVLTEGGLWRSWDRRVRSKAEEA